MKLTTVLIIVTLLQVSAASFAQKVTYKNNKATLEQVFREIRKQTGYNVLISVDYLRDDSLQAVNFKNASLDDVLKQVLANKPLTYTIDDKSVLIKEKATSVPDKVKALLAIPIMVSGKVTDTAGTPLPGATVKNVTQNKSVSTGIDGRFNINAQVGDKVTVSYIGYNSYEFRVIENAPLLRIILQIASSNLSEVVLIGYGTTTKRLNTGSISTIISKDIEKQPVTNVLEALSGRMPGVFVQSTNGLPGGNINIQIRGQNSIRNTPGNNGNYPLYVIDGVPYMSAPIYLDANASATASVVGPVSPLNSLNPGDIESINILKDADATAIYGSRGANGVVLITTKYGKLGKTRVNFTYSQGVSHVANYPQLLNLQQYLEIRKEAFKNDGLTPSTDPTAYPNYAPDLTVWSQTQSTNWAKFLMGNSANTTDLQGSVSGGNEQTQFLISTDYRNQGTVLLGGGSYMRAGLHINLSHTSLDKKFKIQFSSGYTGDNNLIANPYGSIMSEILTAPNFPLYDQSGNLNWSNNINPLADVKAQSRTQTNNFIANSVISYLILPGLNLKTSIGYNRLNSNQTLTNPLSSQNPSYGVSSANYGNGYNQSLIIEPQINYHKVLKSSTLDVLLGGTYQSSSSSSQLISASNFSSDALIQNVTSANQISAQNTSADYKYESVFARVTYNIADKYIFNVSGRRDGSSRFGPGDQFGNFGAIGAAWVFTNETFIKDNIPFLSFGKLRSSYGITGNDQIKDYQYLSTYSSSGFVYQGISGLQSNQIANADLHWETNKKIDVGLEFGVLKDRVSISIDYFRDRSNNQLISYTLPYLTGFANYQANLPAVVQNTGWEFELNTINISSKDFNWKTTFNITIPKNELLSFPGLSSSSYANSLSIGKDISQAIGYVFTGVNPQTGNAQYLTPAGSSDPSYFNQWGQTSPYFYGGFGNTFTYKNFQLDVFGQFSKQYAKGGLYYTPGLTIQNDFTEALARWQKPGDITSVPKASTVYDPYYAYSTANWFNASYFRLKNISFSYIFPTTWLKGKHIDRLRLYIEGQNLITIWKKNSALYDPETGGDNTTGLIPIAPMKSLVAGIQLTL